MNDTLWALPTDMAEAVIRDICSHEATPNPPSALGHMGIQASETEYGIQGGAAIINVSGAIVRTQGYYSSTGQDTIRRQLDAAFVDPRVSSIVLVMNSPGGVVHGTKELADYIAASPKPVATYVDGLCASAAFWLASATGRIFAPKTAMLGSIGVIYMHADFSKFYEDIGIKYTPIVAGVYKAVGNSSVPLSDADKSYLQKNITQIHTIFKADVQKHLALTAPETAWGEAQIFLADEAKNLGLVSAIVQDFDEVIQLVSKENFMEENIMDKQTLATAHPELLAEIEADAVKNAKATSQSSEDALLAVVKAHVNESTYAAIEATLSKCRAIALSPEQITALAPSFVMQASSQENSEQALQTQLLNALVTTGNAPLTSDPRADYTPNTKSALLADAENRASNA